MSRFFAGFSAEGRPVSLRFGAGARADLSPELTSLGIRRALVLTTPQQAPQGQEMARALGPACAGIFTGAAMHTPVEVTEAALDALGDADGLVAIGGGSTVGLAKALAWRTDLPQIVLPTTYAGSEATPVLGQTENGVKSTFASQKVQPEAVVYDPELVASLPLGLTVTSALNAIAHAVEGLYARDGNRLSSALALEGIRAFAGGLPVLRAAPGDLEAREDTLFGAWACGTVLAQVGMALHHKLCHTLGGSLGLPHAETHAILLPHATAYNEAVAGPALAPVARILQADTAADGLYDFAARMGAPRALKDLGVSKADLDRVTELALANPYWNPRPVEAAPLRALLHRAFEGARPEIERTT